LDSRERQADNKFKKDLEGNGSSLIEILSWNVIGRIQEGHEKPQSGQTISKSRFE
jgi:hypothetical protein